MKEFDNKKTMILVVDMVNGFCKKGALAFAEADALIPHIAEFLHTVPQAQKVFVCDNHENDSAEFSAFPPHCHTLEEQAIVPELFDFADAVVPKNSTNGIFALTAAYDLSEYDSFVLCGVCTDICVLSLAMSIAAYLNERDLKGRVQVIKNLCATFSSPSHDGTKVSASAWDILQANGIGLI